jgi:GT2 family glycosyltransferase
VTTARSTPVAAAQTQAEPTARPFISVLLPVRGESRELTECLSSLARQSYPRDRFEVLIADGSDRAIDPAILPGGVDVHVYPNEARVMSPGLNMVAGHARGEYLAIVSAHSYLPDGYFERMVATANATGAANVGTRVRKVATSPWGRAIAAATSSPFGVGSSIQHHGAEAGPADSAFPGFIARPMFEKLGGFNAALACNEDDEFNARVRAAGGLVWYDPAVEVAYRPRETPIGLFRQHFRYGRWKVAVARLGVPGYLRARHAIPSLVVVGAVAGPLGSIIWHPLAIPVAAAAACYVALAIVEGRRMGSRYGAATWRTAVAFPVVHAGYGLGFLRGILDRGLPREGRR